MTSRNSLSRSQRYLFWALAAGILTALAFLLYGCRQAEKRLAAPEDETPIAAPIANGQETIPLYLASDADDSIRVEDRPIALPAEPSTRARYLLEQLLATYALPGSTHPLPSGQAIDDVFLLTLPIATPPAPDSAKKATRGLAPPMTPLAGDTGQLAVINLHGSFADNHPSGVEVEDLTINSIIGTLHADLPSVTQIRFLVDGRERETLAGHADLTRLYPATDTATTPPATTQP